MSGSATLGNNLVDSLLGVVDDIREGLHPDLGVRRFRVYVVTRTWLSEKGVGPYTDEEIEIRPQPLIEVWDTDGHLHNSLEACGVDLDGYIELKEVSLTYTERELGYSVADEMLQDSWVRIEDAFGQGMPARYFRHQRPPYPDANKDIGWYCRLISISEPELE